MLVVIDYQLPNYQPSSSSKRIHTFITAEFKFRIAMLNMLIANTRCIQQFTARRQICLLLFVKHLLGITDERLKNIRINRVQIYAASHTIIQPSSDDGRMKGRVRSPSVRPKQRRAQELETGREMRSYVTPFQSVFLVSCRNFSRCPQESLVKQLVRSVRRLPDL